MSATPSTAPSAYAIAALYRFARFDDPDAIAVQLRALCGDLGTCGTLIVAGEGINGTVAGSDDAIASRATHTGTTPAGAKSGKESSNARSCHVRPRAINEPCAGGSDCVDVLARDGL